jgi:hypothetical protein
MLGDAAAVAAACDIALPDGVQLRRATDLDTMAAANECSAAVFGNVWHTPEAMLRRVEAGARDGGDGYEVWVAEVGAEVVTTGRLAPVTGTDFAGLWAGGTCTEWRGRGIYRALTAARARSALARGKHYLHSDSTEFSRPILERSGLVKCSETTPYVWRR